MNMPEPLLTFAVISVLIHMALSTTVIPTTESTSITDDFMNSSIRFEYQNSSIEMSRNDTDDSTTIPWTKSAFNQQQPLVSTETKDLVVEIVNCGLLPILCLFGIVGNVLSLVILYIQGSQERSNIILVGLALSDTLFLITTILRKVNCLVSKFDKNAAFDANMIMQAQVLMLNIMFGRLTSTMTMLISTERFIAVYFPLKAHFLLTSRRVKFAVGFLYILLFSAMAPLLAMYKVVYVFSRRQQRIIPFPDVTQFYMDNYESIDIYLNLVLNIAFRYTPMCLVCIFTGLIVGRIKKSSSWRRKSSRNVKGGDQVTKMLLLVNCIYILCLMPGTVTITVRYFVDGFNFIGTYSNIFNLLSTLIIFLESFNSSINFIVYMVMSKKFAATYKRVFLCRRRRSQYTENTNQNTNVSTITASTTTL